MRTALQRWLWLVIVLPACTVFAAEPEQGLPQYAVKIDRWGSFITNSMVVSWIVAIGLIIFARVATRNMKGIPGGAQNLFEWLVEGLYNFLESIIGSHLVKRTFWFLATIFIFILSANWLGLIPGVGTIGWGHQSPQGFVVDQPLFRGANADLNLTFAMALIFFACWIVWALQELGPIGFAKELFGPKGDTTGFLKVLMIVVFFASGCLEIVSILFRPVSSGFSSLWQYVLPGRSCWKPCPGWRRASAGCCPFRFISWNCWWASCRRWFLCCCALYSHC